MAETKNADEVVNDFLIVQSFYANRRAMLLLKDDYFTGKHWSGGANDGGSGSTGQSQQQTNDDEYRLVFNYMRRVVLGSVASFSRAPKPRVPIPVGTTEAASADKREKLLLSMWDDMMKAWYDVELNAAKYGFGIFQALWAPEPDQPMEVNVAQGEAKLMQLRYTCNPFKFRSIPPDRFYPVYRTYDHANDFQEVYRFDPKRLIVDLEERYNVTLQETGQITADGWQVMDVLPTCDLIEYWSRKEYRLVARTIRNERHPRRTGKSGGRMSVVNYTLASGPNPYNRIPFWVVQNIRADSARNPVIDGSVSDMEDIIGINLHLNHIISEEADEVVTNIHRPLAYYSDEHKQDPSAIRLKAGEVVPLGNKEDEALEPIAWSYDVKVVSEHVGRLYKIIQDLTFLGEAGFGAMNVGSSGIAARVALSPFQQLLELKLPQRVAALQSVCAYILHCFEQKARDEKGVSVPLKGWVADQYKRYGAVSVTADDIQGAYFVDVTYGNLLPRDDMAFEQGEVYKYKTGAQSLETTLDHLGFDDPQAEITRLKMERQDVVLSPEVVKMTADATMAKQQTVNAPPPAPPPMPMPQTGPQGGPPQGQQMSPQGQQQPQQGPSGGIQPGAAMPPGMQQGMPLPAPQQGGLPGNMPVNPEAGPQPGVTAPPVPPEGAFPQNGGGRPGEIAPFLRRKR